MNSVSTQTDDLNDVIINFKSDSRLVNEIDEKNVEIDLNSLSNTNKSICLTWSNLSVKSPVKQSFIIYFKNRKEEKPFKKIITDGK